MGKRKLLKAAQKLKDCIEKTYKVELQSVDSELYENSYICLLLLYTRRYMFISSHVGKTNRNNQKIQLL